MYSGNLFISMHLMSWNDCYAKLQLNRCVLLIFPNQSIYLWTPVDLQRLWSLLKLDLMVRNNRLFFSSNKLNATQSAWSTIEREAYAALMALQKYRNWVFGSEVTVHSDHNPLLYLTKSVPKSAKLMRWALALQEFLPRCSMQPVFPIAMVSVCPSVCPSVCHSVNCDKTNESSAEILIPHER